MIKHKNNMRKEKKYFNQIFVSDEEKKKTIEIIDDDDAPNPSHNSNNYRNLLGNIMVAKYNNAKGK